MMLITTTSTAISTLLVFLSLLLSLVEAAPMGPYPTKIADPLKKRQVATLCDQFAYWSGDGYAVNNNNWGRAAATSGSQCTYVDSSSSGGVSWHTTWTWNGGSGNVKSYANGGRVIAKNKIISSLNAMPTSVSWQYNTSDIRANVAYDFFTAKDPNHSTSSGDYELMIWLADYGNVSPIGSSTGTVSVGGRDWNLHVGTNGNMKVYSFVATSTTNSFSGDAKDFFDYLTDNESFPADTQNLLVFQLGSEAFTGGPATLTVSDFSADVY